MSRIIKTFFLAIVLGGFARADECQCCGITSDVIGAITNAALANCSSNCVRLTPETCTQVKDGITNYLYSIDSTVDYAVLLIDNSIVLASTISSYLEQLQTDLESLKVDMSPSSASTVYARINDMRGNMGNYVTNVLRNVDSSGGTMLYSNKTTGAYVNLQYNLRVGPEILKNLMPNLKQIEDALGYFERAESNKFNQAKDQIDDAISNLYPLSGQLGDFRMQLVGVQYELNQIKDDAVPLREMMESFDCQPCGKGGGSGSSGGGTSVDLTPVIAAVQQLNDDLKYWMQRLYSLFQKYYQDYDTAASQGITGKATLQGYQSLPNNWFKRIEYLLYSMADLQEADTSDVPQTPDGDDDLSDFESSSSSSAESQDSTLRSKAESSLNKVRTSVDNFLSAFQRLGFVNQNIDGSIVMEFPSTLDDSGTHYQLTIPQGFTSTFNFLRVAFKFVWYAGLLFLYWYFVKFAIFCIVSYVRWFLTLCSAVFGG